MWLTTCLTSDFKKITNFCKDNGKAIASVKQQQIILAKPVELFEQHLAFTDVGAVQRGREHQFGTGQKQAKHQLIGQGGALDMAGAQTKAKGRGISGNQPDTLPALQARSPIGTRCANHRS